MAQRLKAMILPIEAMRHPWLTDLAEMVGDRHDLVFYDDSRPPAEQLRDIDVIVDQGGIHATSEIADNAAGIKLCQILGTGFDHFDLAYWRTKGVPICNTPGRFSGVALGETAMMFMLMLARGWHVSQRALQNRVRCEPLGFELVGRRLLIVGLGASGLELARRAKAFGMRISAIEVCPVSEHSMAEMGIESVSLPQELDGRLPAADFVSLHLPYNEQTHHMIDRRRLALMRADAYLINVARGALADEQALYDALSTGQLAGAGLDVFSREPVDPGLPLLQLPNVIATPHIAGVTRGTSQGRAKCIAENLDRIANGLQPLYRIDR